MSKSGSEKRIRNYTVSTRTTEDEKNAIQLRANAHGLSLGAYLRDAALDKALPNPKRLTSDQSHALALILASIGLMTEYIRELESASEPPLIKPALSPLKSELLFVRDQCFRSMRRRP